MDAGNSTNGRLETSLLRVASNGCTSLAIASGVPLAPRWHHIGRLRHYCKGQWKIYKAHKGAS